MKSFYLLLSLALMVGLGLGCSSKTDQNPTIPQQNLPDSSSLPATPVQFKDKPPSPSIKSVSRFALEDSNLLETKLLSAKTLYLPNGKIEEEIKYDEKGAESSHTYFRFTEEGKQIENKTLEPGKPPRIYLFTYESEGKKEIRRIGRKGGGWAETTEIIELPTGGRKEVLFFQDSLFSTTEFDPEGRMTNRTLEKSGESIFYHYDAQGNIKSRVRKKRDGITKEEIITNEYDSYGNLLKQESEREINQYEYDQYGNKTYQMIIDKKRDLQWEYVFEYTFYP